MPDIRGRLRGRRGGRGGARHDPDRELDRRSRRRHPPPPADLGPAHRRRALSADPLPAHGVPTADLGTIKHVYSHVHALGQCRKIIRKLGLKAHVAGDTAGSAREVAESGDPTRASLAPRLAAEVYGLKVLAEDVEDETHNTTRFIVLSKTPQWTKPGNGPAVTSFVFRVRNLPAALYKALGGFATNGINMTKLESYMLEGEFLATQFYAEVDGHPDDVPLQAGARGTRLLFQGDADPRRLSRPPVPQGGDGSRRVISARLP